MAADDAGEKTEQPTPRKIREAREQGQVPRSTDLTATLGLLGGIVLLKLLGLGIFQTMLGLTRGIGEPSDITGGSLKIWISKAADGAIWITIPFLALLVLCTGLGALVQSRPVFAWKKLTPSLDKLNPIKGFKKLFSVDSLTRLGMGLVKMGIIGSVAYYTIRTMIGSVLGAGALPVIRVFDLACDVIFTLAMRMLLALLILALIDYLYQRWRLMKNLRMTKQEVKDELKRMEGDPLMKQRRLQIQAKLAMQRIGVDVPQADVVVSNPTEFAVAIKYDEATMAAPRLTAKGADFLALRIRQVAQLHGIPIVQRPPLARAIYASVDVGHEVPPEFYKAVAEVLAYVYQISGRAAASRG
ncbi:MAG: flagellar biosynthesis protein FlhB [Planctomycetes bacterium]|nr:flagellar biosynthesis protein FlhB [Planctomycetota bacterium]